MTTLGDFQAAIDRAIDRAIDLSSLSKMIGLIVTGDNLQVKVLE